MLAALIRREIGALCLVFPQIFVPAINYRPISKSGRHHSLRNAFYQEITMDGVAFLKYFKEKVMGSSHASDVALAKVLGVTQPALKYYRRDLTNRQVVNLMERYARKAEARLAEQAIITIVEYFPLEPVQSGRNWKIFAPNDHTYLVGLQEHLGRSHGIYIFHDSSGRSIYAGKAKRQSIWTEMNLAFNRDRGEVQSIYRVDHPTNQVRYRGAEEMDRPIKKRAVALYDLARYVTAYQVADELIDKLEGLIVRSFANDLLNVRMEKVK
jgi:hypothetical protein